MNRRVLAAMAACGLSVGLLVAMVPRPDELFEARMRDAGPAATVRLLEEAVQARPGDVTLAGRLAEACEKAVRPARGLEALAVVGRARALTSAERGLAMRLGFAAGHPDAAVPILTGPHEVLGAAEHAAIVKLALAANQPRLALAHQAAVAKAAPTAKALVAWRDLALAAGDMPQAIAAQKKLAAKDDPAALERLASLSLGANDPKGALEAAERILEHHDTPAWRQKAADFAQWAKLAQRAVPHLMALYRHQPSAASGLKVAQLLVTAAPGEAIAFASRLVADYPRDAQALDHYLGLLTRAGRQGEARALLAARAARWPDDAKVHTRRVDFLLAQGDRQGAIAELSRWTARHRGDRDARHQLAVVQVWDGRTAQGWNTYQALLASADGPMDRLETMWREEWAKVSGSLEDFTPEGRSNLRLLTAAKPADVALWRRLAAAENEAGNRAEAIRAQRKVVAARAARGDDALRLAEWLIWDNQTAEGLSLLKALDDRSPLPAEVLEDAAERAGKAWRFAEAADFLGRLAERKPNDAEAWESLARAEEAADDLAGAQRALTHRLALPGATGGHRMLAAGLAMRREQFDEALAIVSVKAPDRAELELQAYLGDRLKRPAVRRRALETMVKQTPTDWESRLQLADLAEARGDQAEAAEQESAALAVRPKDSALIARVAGRRLYSASPEAAAPFVSLLEKLDEPGPEGWQLLADYYQGRDDHRAARALDRLHALNKGTAETYFRRGELAAQADDGAIADRAFSEAARRGASGKDPAIREAGAYALERLGRDGEADVAWTSLTTAFPDRPSAHVALARRAIAKGDLGAASALLAAAEAIAPTNPETRLARAEWLRAAGREAEAAEAFATLRHDQPGARYLAAAEAMSRHSIGQWGRARAVVREAVAAAPFDKDLSDTHRQVRELGASRVEATGFFEQGGNLSRQRVGLSSVQRLGDRVRLLADVSQLAWDGGNLSSRELKLGARWSDTALDVAGHVAVQSGLAAPLGDVAVGVNQGPLKAEARLDEMRWEETNAAVAANGRERRGSAEVAWQPDPRFNLRAGGGLGLLSADGLAGGVSATGLFEAVARPQAYSPWLLAYQLNHRHWGAAGTPVGLPTDMTLHSLLLGYDGRLGPLRVELRPGVMHDLRNGGFSPLAGGNVAWEIGPDQELLLQGVWSGQSFVSGAQGAYTQLNVTGQWFF